MPRPKRLLLLGLSLVSASFLGWSIAASLTSQTTAFANRTDDDLQVEQLLDRRAKRVRARLLGDEPGGARKGWTSWVGHDMRNARCAQT